MDLKQKTILGIKWTFIGTIFSALLQLVQLSILAKLLEPTAFGLMSLVMIVIGFSQSFLDMGISNAIIYKQNITNEQLSSLYFGSIFVGCCFFIVIVILAPLLAEFYKEQELTKLLILMAVIFLIQPFGQQFMVLWQKEMRFSEITKIDIINKIVSFIVSIFLAYYGYGVYSLVFGTLSGVIIQTILFMYLGLKEYKFSFVFKLFVIKEFLIFGAYQTGEKTVNYFNFQIDNILIGKFFGVEQLGVYSIAKQIVMRPSQIINPIITKVTLPAMAKITDNTYKLKDIYLKTINYLSTINFPIYVFIFIFAHEIVIIMFGDKYLESIIIMQILAIWAAIRSTLNPIGSLLSAKGQAKRGFWWNMALLAYVPIGIYFASFWGLQGVGFGLILLQISLIIPSWYFLVEPLCGAKFIEYHKEIFIPMIIALLVWTISYFSVIFIQSIFLKFVIGIIVGLSSVIIFNNQFNKKFIIELKGFKK